MTNPKPTLSVVMIARDEAWRIEESLASVRFADEIIVADTGSKDETVLLAESLGARVFSIPFEGFGPAKQRALDEATCDWVLSLDADEIVSSELRCEIEAAMAENRCSGYILPRQAWFLGRPIRYGGWGRDELLRLFKREKGRFSDDIIHERALVEGSCGKLKSPLDHHTDPFFPRYVAKVERYSTLAAETIAANPRKRVGLGPAFAHSIGNFLRKYIVKGGFLDGTRGAIIAASSAYATFLRYTKAALIRRGELKITTELEEIPRRKS